MAKPKRDKPQTEKNRIITLFKEGKGEEALALTEELIAKYARDHELFYLKGMILSARNAYVDATNCFQKALSLQPTHAESAFELGVIDMTLCRFNKAAEHLRTAKMHGYSAVHIHHYLKQIEQVARPKDVMLSACMIVKNEEKHLPGCLRSLQAIADEIVVVDTGSTDQTIAIAKSFGAKVLHYEWQKDFAAARNFAAQNASGDWIIQLDADEELFPEDQHKVRELIHQNECNGAFLALHNRVSTSFGENQPAIHYLVRLYKNHPDFYFENAIHETLKISGEVLPVDINILHHGYNLDREYLLKKRQRNAQILYGRLQENPDSMMNLFYLSMMHLGNRQLDLAESFALKALPLIDPKNKRQQHVYVMLLNNLGLIANERRDYVLAKQYCFEAIKINENYLDPYFFLGMAHFSEGDFKSAENIFLEYVQRNEAQAHKRIFNLFGSSADTYLFQVYHFLGKVYRKQNDNVRAQKWIEKAVDANPNFWVGLVDLAYIAVDAKDWFAAADYLERAIKLARKNPAVNKQNKKLWFDFTNAVKTYARVLRKIRQHSEANQEAPVAH